MGAGRGMNQKQVPANPGLPHRRYSVPEIVMRKYTLTKQRSESAESGVATVPAASPNTISSSATDYNTSPDTSDNGGSNSSMGNRVAKKSPVPYETELTKSGLDTVSEELNELGKGKASGDTLDRVSSLKEDTSPAPNSGKVSSQIKAVESGQNLCDTPDLSVQEQGTPEPLSSGREEVTSSQTINLVSTESMPDKQEDPATSETKSLTCEIEVKRDPVDSTELQNKAREELSSPHTLVESRAQSSSNREAERTTPESVELQTSSPLTGRADKPQSSPNKGEQESSNSVEPQSSRADDLSSSQSLGVQSSENNKQAAQSPPKTADSTEPQSTIRDELSSTQTVTIESTESNKDRKLLSRSNSIKDVSAQNNQTMSAMKRHSSSAGVSPLDTEDTLEPKTYSRDELSSSQTMGIESTDSRPSTNLNKESQDRTSSTPGGDVSFTPTECCVSTPDPEHPQSMSSASDRASESCSITTLGQTSESSASGTSPERPSVTLRSSPEQPSSDPTLSIKSDSIILGRPVSVLARRSDSNKQLQVSDSDHSTGHVEFMNETESCPLVNMIAMASTYFDSANLEKSHSTDSSSQQTGDSGHATEPDCKLGEQFCGTSKLNNPKLKVVNHIAESVPVIKTRKHVEPVKCKHHSKSWKIIIQPTVLNNSSKCNAGSSCEKETELQQNKLAILPTKNKEDPRNYEVVTPTAYSNSKSESQTAGDISKTPTSPTRTEDSGPYSWSRLTDEGRMVQLQHQRHRLWMNRKLSAANALPPSPLHGPLSYGIGAGSAYKKNYDVQLVVPRYSALPRSVSMLVNTSSGECSSNSNSDSECLSLVDSLEEGPSSLPGAKHDSKPVRGDIIHLIPEETTCRHEVHNRINPATPRGRGKAFFVSMSGGPDEAGEIEVLENVEKPIVSQSMPDRLKKKLMQRYKQMELKKKKKKRTKGQNEDNENIPNTQNHEENLQKRKLIYNANYPIQRVQDLIAKNKNQTTTQEGVLIQTEEKLTNQSISKKPSHRRRQSVSQDFTLNSATNIEREKLGAGVPVQMRKMSTAIFHQAPQSAHNGTFILSKNGGDEERPTKPSEQKVRENTSSVEKMVKKEDIPEERSPPIKRFRASRIQILSKTEGELEKDLKNNKETEKELNQKIKTNKRAILTQNSLKDKNEGKLPQQTASDYLKQKPSESEKKLQKQSIQDDKKILPEQITLKNEKITGGEQMISLEHRTRPPESIPGISEQNVLAPIASQEDIESKVTIISNGQEKDKIYYKLSPDGFTNNNINSEKHHSKKQISLQKSSIPRNKQEHKSLRGHSGQCTVSPTNEKAIVEETNSPEKSNNGTDTQQNIKDIQPQSDIKLKSQELVTTEGLKQHQLVEINNSPPKGDRLVNNQQPGHPELEKPVKTDRNSEQLKNSITDNEIVKNKNNTIKKNMDKIHYPVDNKQHQEPQLSKKTDTGTIEKKSQKETNYTPSNSKACNNNSCQTTPPPKTVEDKSTSAPVTPPQPDNSPSVSEPTSKTSKLQLQIKSGIPIMKSPIGIRKLSPDTVITLHQSLLKNSHLPVRRNSKLLHPPPVRRSANLLGGRFQQKFEVIPEERSVSLESYTEDQHKQTNERVRRASLPTTGNKSGVADRINIVPHSCLGYTSANINLTHNKPRQNLNTFQRQAAISKESSSSNYDETSSSNGNAESINSDRIIKKTNYLSRIPKAEKFSHQSKVTESSESTQQLEEKKLIAGYQGKAALAPHNEDKDLLTISKGWINFYLLKSGRDTPDSTCSEGNN